MEKAVAAPVAWCVLGSSRVGTRPLFRADLHFAPYPWAPSAPACAARCAGVASCRCDAALPFVAGASGHVVTGPALAPGLGRARLRPSRCPVPGQRVTACVVRGVGDTSPCWHRPSPAAASPFRPRQMGVSRPRRALDTPDAAGSLPTDSRRLSRRRGVIPRAGFSVLAPHRRGGAVTWTWASPAPHACPRGANLSGASRRMGARSRHGQTPRQDRSAPLISP